MEIVIENNFINEALDYSKLSRSYTSDGHDFHEGGLNAKQRKMFEGKLGEKGIKQYFLQNNIHFIEDSSSHKEADNYDFVVIKGSRKYLIDVKTRTKKFHIRTLEMVKQLHRKKIDVYISVRLIRVAQTFKIKIIGWTTKNDILKLNRVENNGYLDNYVLYDKELRDITEFGSWL